MKTKEISGQQREPRLFKPELKFMDFWHVTNDYLKTTSLNEQTKKEVMIRIHNFSIHLNETIALYPTGKKKINQRTYDTITAGLKESVRRAKISLALNHSFKKPFIAYWKYLSGVLVSDATLINDENLLNTVYHFEYFVSTIN